MKTFYAINLNGKYQGTSRWALYELIDGEMTVVWPTGDGTGGRRDTELPNQVYSGLKNYPAYHFVVNGYGLSHVYELTNALARHYKDEIKVHELNGYMGTITTAGHREGK
jgi:hypothetical protein